MQKRLYEIVKKWLADAGYKPDLLKLETLLRSHPDYNMLSSITETLEELNISHVAATLPFSETKNLTEPYLAYIKQDDTEQFALITPKQNGWVVVHVDKAKSYVLTQTQFAEIFTGTIVAVDNNDGTFINSKLNTFKIALVCVLEVSVIVLALFKFQDWLLFSYTILSLVASIVCVLIIAQQAGIASRFCNLSASTDCNAAFSSKYAKLFKGFNLGDAGIVYFHFQLTVLLLLTNSSYSVLYFLSLLALPFIPYSIYLQKAIIKKWCPLCLAILVVIFLHGSISIVAVYKQGLQLPTVLNIASIALAGCIVLCGWLLIRPFVKIVDTYKEEQIENLSFRRNRFLLLPYLSQQPTIKVSDSIAAMQLGNPNGSLKITLITNPLCQSCIELHSLFEKLQANYEQISLKLIFYVPLNEKDPRTIIAGNILNNAYNPVVINEWYTNRNIADFTNKYGKTISKPIREELTKHKNWCHKNNIYITPTLLINGKRFPTFYRPNDVQYFIESFINLPEADSNVKQEAATMVLVDNT